MSFMRTDSGISNIPQFHNVDLIIYTEGGTKSHSIDEVISGMSNTKSPDVKFWAGIFRSAGFARKIKFKPIGSKTASNLICEKIISGEIKNSATTRDRDLDFILGVNKSSPLILYTKGYSWENDVFNEKNTKEQIASMLYDEDFIKYSLECIEQIYNDYRKIGKRLLHLEIIYRPHGIDFITLIKGDSYLNNKKSSIINKKSILNFLSRKRKSTQQRPLRSSINTKALCPIKDNYGKLLAS